MLTSLSYKQARTMSAMRRMADQILDKTTRITSVDRSSEEVVAKRKPAGRTAEKIEEFAEDLGRILGTATAKAERWLGQRKEIATRLAQIRDTASRLLSDLGHQAQSRVRRVGRRVQTQTAMTAPPRRRKLSAKARKAISDAQKRRWAAQKAAEKQK
jgi:hypothetical protein